MCDARYTDWVPITVSIGSDVEDLCSIECLMVFAAEKFTEVREARRKQIAELEAQVKSLGGDVLAQCPRCHEPFVIPR